VEGEGSTEEKGGGLNAKFKINTFISFFL